MTSIDRNGIRVMIIRGIEEHDLRAALDMPKVREWMNSHSWLVNIIVCVVFIVLILS